MRAPEQTLLLKNGVCCTLRSPVGQDAAQRTAFLRQVNLETRFLARGAEDTPCGVEWVAELLEEQLEDDAVLEVAAFAGGEMVASGSIGPVSRGYPRKRHRAQMGICVRRSWWSQGIGGAILAMLMAEAPAMGFSQLELSVVEDNQRALRLYERLGFVEMGRMPNALRYEDGSAAAEIWMVRRI